MAKKVTVIKAAKAQKHTQEERRLKVCGYARVSTGSQAQATSYTAQVEYYTEKIESNPLWEFAGVYADEGISGTNVKHRDEFQMMISDCEHRPDPYEIHHKICKKYGGMHPDHPKAEGDWRWNLL